MAYLQGRFTSNFNLQFITVGCNSTIFWFPDGSDSLRDSISYSYMTFLGRYGEQSGVEYWVNYWNNGGGQAAYNGSVSNMIQDGALGSGELGFVNTYGRHSGMTLGGCVVDPPGLSLVVYKQGGSNAGYGNIPLGQYVVFSWSTTNEATSVNIYLKSGPPGASAPGSVAASGSRIYYPPVAGTYIYYIAANGPGGTSSSFNYPVEFTVYNPFVYGCTDSEASNYNPNANTDNGSCVYPAPTASLDISSTYICPSGSSTLSWSTSNTTSVYITGIGYVGSSGSISVSLFYSTTYTLTATGRGGSTQKNQTVTVYQYADVTMSAARTTITRGESTTLTWSTSGSASSAYFSPGLGFTNLSGSYSVTPNTTTTYTIGVTGPCNYDIDQVTITVLQPPPAISYLIVYKQDGSNAGYGNIPIGQYVIFSWQVTGTVTSVSLNLLSGPSGASAPGSVDASGSRIYYPPVVGTYTYYITATGPGGTVSGYDTPFTFTVYNPVVYGCTDSAATNYNPNANTDNGSCVYPAPTASISVSPTYICPSGSLTLSWSVSNATSISISNIGSVASSGSISVSPFSSTTYTLTASGRGGSTQKNQTVTVYQYADVTMSANRTTIVRGESVTLTWSTSGSSASASAYFSPGLGSTNLSGSYSVTPNTTTTYTIAVTGTCNNDSAQVTITVLQPPSIAMVAPPSLNYNQQSTVSYSVTNIPTTLTMIPSYEYTNGSIVYGSTVNLPTSDNYSGTFPTNIPYNIYGPRIVNYLLNGIGYGNLADAETTSININIDETPDNVIIPGNVGIINQLVVSPDKDITSYKVQINDIDIPVEIKSNHPIQVDIDDQDNWTGVRQI